MHRVGEGEQLAFVGVEVRRPEERVDGDRREARDLQAEEADAVAFVAGRAALGAGVVFVGGDPHGHGTLDGFVADRAAVRVVPAGVGIFGVGEDHVANGRATPERLLVDRVGAGDERAAQFGLECPPSGLSAATAVDRRQLGDGNAITRRIIATASVALGCGRVEPAE